MFGGGSFGGGGGFGCSGGGGGGGCSCLISGGGFAIATSSGLSSSFSASIGAGGASTFGCAGWINFFSDVPAAVAMLREMQAAWQQADRAREALAASAFVLGCVLAAVMGIEVASESGRFLVEADIAEHLAYQLRGRHPAGRHIVEHGHYVVGDAEVLHHLLVLEGATDTEAGPAMNL